MPIKKIKKKPGRKPKKKPYFGIDVQEAIVRYNALDQQTQQSKRNKIYQEEIHKAFDKLAENIINTFKFTYFDYGFTDIKHETVAFMVMNIHKYDHTKGSKAFSYFSVVAKNYLILHNNNNYKKLKSHDTIEVLNKEKNMIFDENDFDSFTIEMIEYFDKNLNTIFKKERDLKIGYAIIDLIKQRDEIENFNKKAIYILIREMTNVETAHITSVVNVLKKHYKKLINKYHTTGTIMVDNSGSFF
jgi:hypothetical protein